MTICNHPNLLMSRTKKGEILASERKSALNSRKRIIVLLVFIALITICILQTFRGPVPEMYNGRPITALIDDLGNGRADTMTAEVQFEKIGPRATPYLLAALKRRNSLFHSTYAFLYPRLPQFARARLPPPSDAVAIRQTAAIVTGSWVHPCVPPSIAIPALLDALDDEDAGVRMDAAGGVDSPRRHWEEHDPIGCTTYDKVAIEKLLRIATTDTDKDVRANAIASMCSFKAAATYAFDFWRTTAKAETGQARSAAIYGLDKFSQLSPDLIPALNDMAINGNKWQKELAGTCLQKLKTNQLTSPKL